MAKQRYINTHFWDDSYIRTISPAMKLVFLYLLTNPLTNIAGAYEISLDRMAFDLQMDAEKVKSVLEKFAADGRVLYKDGWVLIPNFIKNQVKSDSVQKGIEEVVKYCPDWIKDTLCTRYDTLSYLILSNLNKSKPKRKFRTKPEVVEIFEEWKTVLNKKSFLDLKRSATLDARLAEGFSVDDLKLVPHGALKSPWHCGDNPQRKKYFDVSTLYKNSEQVEKFIELARQEIIPIEVERPIRTEAEKLAAFKAQQDNGSRVVTLTI